MAANEELLIARKSWTHNHKTRNDHNLKTLPSKKVHVLYYLSRNGQLGHPHLIDVPLSSLHGLYLRDVMNALNSHRGTGIANMYSWSFKRNYKNGYVWHDASEEDLIQPSNNHDYILKGSELLQTHTSQTQPQTYHTSSTCTSVTPAEATFGRRNNSWSSFDNPHEYLVVKCESSRELASKFAPDAATQTEEQHLEHVSVEVCTEDIPSSPPSNSSSEVMEAVNGSRNGDQHGRMKVSRVLLQLITCGAESFRNETKTK